MPVWLGGFDPSPPAGAGFSGRCEYIPVSFGLDIHVEDAR